jgi:K+-sensing histidine kinase KdpD
LNLDFQIRGLVRSKTYFHRVREEKKSADETLQNVKHVLSISRELNGIRDVNKLLTIILQKAREVTHADAGSIYVVEQEGQGSNLIFKISQNESINLNLSEFKMKISDKSIVGNSIIHMKTINIPDL